MIQSHLDPAASSVAPQLISISPQQACAQCGNVYDKAFQVIAHGKTYTFDCFECAIALLAPSCSHCKVRIIGHGLESAGQMYCCDHCAEREGVTTLRDRS